MNNFRLDCIKKADAVLLKLLGISSSKLFLMCLSLQRCHIFISRHLKSRPHNKSVSFCYFTHVWPSLCRMMFVKSLTPGGCFHIHLLEFDFYDFLTSVCGWQVWRGNLKPVFSEVGRIVSCETFETKNIFLHHHKFWIKEEEQLNMLLIIYKYFYLVFISEKRESDTV